MSLFGKTLCLVHPIVIIIYNVYLCVCVRTCTYVPMYLRTCVRVGMCVCVCMCGLELSVVLCVFISSSLWFNSVFTNLSALPYWWVSR